MKVSMWVHVLAVLLVVVGAINWGLIGLANYNLVSMLFSSMPELEKIVYILVGVSGVYLLIAHKQDCKTCAKMR